MTDFRIRFNVDTEDVELVLDDKVVDTVGTEVVQSWMTAYNDKHGFAKQPVQVEEVETTEVTTDTTTEGESTDGQEQSTEGEVTA